MNTERQNSVPVSRQALLKGMAGMAVAAGTRHLRTSGSPTPGAIPARSAHPHGSQRASVTVDLSQATGRTVQPYLYGYASGALLDNDFQLAANGVIEKSAETLAPTLIRFNTPASTIIQSVFANGISQPNWTPLANWIQHRADFLKSRGRLIFGIGPAGTDTSIPHTKWAEYAKATAQHFRRTGQEITHWEVGNECDHMDVKAYYRYFNAIADALHSVNPAYLVGGPVASWWDGISLPPFISHCGARLGFIDFHSYPVNETDSTQTAYGKAATFADVMSARQAIAGTAAAGLPIGLLEYNMNGGQQPDGTWGLPAQGTIVGAIYVALLLTRAFSADSNFTMGAVWDLVADSNYGAIGNAQDGSSYRAIDEQGWYLRQAARIMPGQQVLGTTTAPDLQVLATMSGQRLSVQLVNYDLKTARSVAISVKGGAPSSPIRRWELSANHSHGHVATITSLARVSLPPQSVVILRAQLQ